MRQAIETRYAGPTNHSGARVIVRAQAGRMTVSWDHALDVDQNHAAAAKAFAERYRWFGRWVGGGNATGTGNTFVNVDDSAWHGRGYSFVAAENEP